MMTATGIAPRFLSQLRAAVAEQLPEYLPAQRWFGAKARPIQSVLLADCIALPGEEGRALIALVRVEFAEGPEETYILPLLEGPSGDASPEGAARQILRLHGAEPDPEIVLSDALANQEFLTALLGGIRGNSVYSGEQGDLQGQRTESFEKLLPEKAEVPPGRVLKAEQSNSSIVYGDRLILKFYRRVEQGINPDLEIGRFLTETAHFSRTPPFGGSLEYQTRGAGGRSLTIGMLQGFVPNQGDAWSYTLRSLKELAGHAILQMREDPSLRTECISAQKVKDLPAAISKEVASRAKFMGLLGKRTAELHLALASPTADPAFTPEPYTPAIREALEGSLHGLTLRNFALLRAKTDALPEKARQTAQEVQKLEEDILLMFHGTLENDISAMRTRIHGDYHLGQVLCAESDFVIIDFEGEPARPLSERRAKRSPLQDVAGMLRSFHYAERSALLPVEGDAGFAEFSGAAARILSIWRAEASRQFLEDYTNAAKGAAFLSKRAAESESLLRLHLLEKAIYELGYELNNRPDWVGIPLHGIQELAGRKAQGA